MAECRTEGRIGWAAALVLLLASLIASPATAAPDPGVKIPIRVVVVTTFELGADTGDTPGEFQNWVERLPLKQVLPFPAGNRALRYNPQMQVLGLVTGSGSINAAASIMALGLDPRFDLSKAYWVLAGIAGINPKAGSVGSAAWAEWVVDRDLTYEIDAREIPPDWPTGLVPLGRSRPFQAPPPQQGIFSPNVYHLNADLVNWAYRLTADTPLDDTADLKAIRAGYPDFPEALKPPHVIRGDEVSAMDWWMGSLMAKSAEDWMAYWTGGKGVCATTAMEDSGVIHALQMLTPSGRVDVGRLMVLRTASDYAAPAKGQTAAQLLASEASSDTATQLSAFGPSLEAAYRVGSRVVVELASHWDRYADHPPAAAAP
ncbi:MAG: purine nucleoside permease [Caulobacteraceae bacterium]|nr:purine nucleoside permease [Caulobacteraceae bacterium]